MVGTSTQPAASAAASCSAASSDGAADARNAVCAKWPTALTADTARKSATDLRFPPISRSIWTQIRGGAGGDGGDDCATAV